MAADCAEFAATTPHSAKKDSALEHYEKAIGLLGAKGADVAVTTIAPMDSASDADGRYPEVDCRNATIRRAA